MGRLDLPDKWRDEDGRESRCMTPWAQIELQRAKVTEAPEKDVRRIEKSPR